MTARNDSEITDREGRLHLLEGRRLALDNWMWQVPALIFAGQAFLLQVLTDPDVNSYVAVSVAAAGILGSAAAGLSLIQQRRSERWYTEQVSALAIGLGRGDPRRPELLGKRRLRAYHLWLSALAAFLIADIVAVLATW